MNVAVAYSCRADKGLAQPVFDALESYGLNPKWIDASDTVERLSELYRGFDAILCPCDRKEIVLFALECFYQNIPIFHMDGGETESGSSYDNTGRWVLTRLASLIFTNTEEGRRAVIKSGEEPWRVHSVGYTFMDGIKFFSKKEITEKYGFPEDYDIVIYNPDVYSAKRVMEDMNYIFDILDKFTIILRPNHDKNFDIVNGMLNHCSSKYGIHLMSKFDARDEFISVLRYCKRFIGNSSAMLHEAPYLEVECIPVGERNAGRKKPVVDPVELGASERIARLIKNTFNFVDGEFLIRKKVVL